MEVILSIIGLIIGFLILDNQLQNKESKMYYPLLRRDSKHNIDIDSYRNEFSDLDDPGDMLEKLNEIDLIDHVVESGESHVTIVLTNGKTFDGRGIFVEVSYRDAINKFLDYLEVY
jgi:hypothetical protein